MGKKLKRVRLNRTTDSSDLLGNYDQVDEAAMAQKRHNNLRKKIVKSLKQSFQNDPQML